MADENSTRIHEQVQELAEQLDRIRATIENFKKERNRIVEEFIGGVEVLEDFRDYSIKREKLP